MTIAVTGPLACGKSTFVRILGELGAETISADALVHDLLLDDEKTIRRITGRFGEGVLGEDGGVDRRALAGVVFGDTEALKDLEGILHPLVREETDRRISASSAEVFVAEIPLLFEGERSGQFDLTVAVTAPEERRKAWAAERGMGEEQRRAIEARQLSQEEKARRADVVVENDLDLDKLKDQAKGLFERVRGENGRRGHGGEEG